MRITEALRQEHRVIEQILELFERIVQRATVRYFDGASVRRVLNFLTDFADRLHCTKEEDHLFRVLQQRGFSRRGGLAGVIFFEHDRCRQLLAELRERLPLAEAGDAAALGGFVAQAREYCLLMRQHLAKEDHCLFPLVDELLTADDDFELLHAFAAVDIENLACNVAVAQQLAKRPPTPPQRSYVRQRFNDCWSHQAAAC